MQRRMPEKKVISEYEQKRLARLQRNRQVMRDLGLPTTIDNNVSNVTCETIRRRTNIQHDDKPKEQPMALGPRKSMRLVSVPKPDYKELPTQQQRITRSKRESPPTIQIVVDSDDDDEPSPPPLASSSSKSRKSCIDVHVHIDELSSIWVGKVFSPPANSGAMKETVMKQVGFENPVFSKYSGVQEFKNAVILFVNVGCSKYENAFHSSGQGEVAMDWYASPRVKPDARVVKRLCSNHKLSRDVAAGVAGDEGKNMVFLFLRFEGEPYLSCGPVHVLETDLDRAPLRFRLDILRAADLVRFRAGKLFNQLVKGERDEDDDNEED